MNIFNIVLIPLVILLYFMAKNRGFTKELIFAAAGGALIFGLTFLIEFPVSWSLHKSVVPTFGSLYLYSLLRETLLPIVLALLGYWLLRGSLWKKNESLKFEQLLVYFALIFYGLSVSEIIYNRFDSNLYQVLVNPMQKLMLVFAASQLIFCAEQFNSRVGALFFALLVPAYAALLSLSYATYYSLNGVFLLLTIPLFLSLPLFILLFGGEWGGGLALAAKKQ